jgi:2-keto-3-deoxy-L-rhamnonate aldolase RhmA
MTLKTTVVAVMIAAAFGLAAPAEAQGRLPILDVWESGKTAFGVFVPNENPMPPRGQGAAPAPGTPRPAALYTRDGGERLAMNPLYDYVFLNLEGRYDADAITAIADGLRSPKAVSRKMLLVRIPTIEAAGAEVTRARIREAFDRGADGVTVPHVRSVQEAQLVAGFFKEAGVNIWTPKNPGGDKLAMIMLEDPGAVAQAKAIADVPGISILACGIGSLTGALKGDREAAERGNQQILAESKRVGLPNMLTASPADVEKRVAEGFLALLGQGPQGDEMIRIGRKAAGRE